MKSAIGLLAVLLCAVPAAADVRDYIGRTLIDVRVEVAGTLLVEPAVLQLVETRVGEPLSMERVRETVDHLVGLGRFDDIRVFAEPVSGRPDAATLRWLLQPVQRIGQIEIAGAPGFPADLLRAQITERVGSAAATRQVAPVVQALEAFYRDRGYRTPGIEPRIDPGRTSAGLATLVLTVTPGPRTTIAAASVTGTPLQPAAQILARLNAQPGRPYDRAALNQRLAALEQDLQGLGHYEAHADASATFSPDGRTAAVVIRVEPGPRVRVVFAGDPLPQNRRDDLVPIQRERSLDLDLLEDASRNIEAYLRLQGYRAAQAPYLRETRGGETILTFTVARGPLHRLAALVVGGNVAMPRERLDPLLKLETGEPLVDSRISAVAAAITELYRVDGFARASVRAEIAVQPEDQGYRPAIVRLLITEGARTVVRDVGLEGVLALPEPRVRGLLTLTTGRPYYRPMLDADRSALEQAYRDEGFQNVRVDARTVANADGSQVDVSWNVREGSRTIVDHVLVSGNFRTDADLIRREVVLQPGKPLGDSAIVESQRRLAALGLFRRVRIVELPHGASETRDVLIEVEEAPATALSYGGGLEAGRRLRSADGQAEERIEVAPRAFFEITRRNLWGKNRSISGFTRVSFRPRDPGVTSLDPTDDGGYGFNEYRVWGAFREPRLFDLPGDLQITGFLEQAIRTSFNFRRRGVRAEYARRVRENITLSGRYNFDHTQLFDEQIQPEDQLLIDRLFPQVRLSTFTASVLRDSRNDVLDPVRGTVLGIDGTVAARAIGSEVGFVKTFMQAFGYRRLPGGAPLTLAAGVRVGMAIGFLRLIERVDEDGIPVLTPDGLPVVEEVDDVPASERFFAGGDSTVRGFVLDRLGTEETLDDQGFPQGGGGLVVVNAELRTPYWKGLGGVGFFDAGNVFRRAGDIGIDELRPTAGFGVRYRSPLGPIRVDLGFNLDPKVLPNGDKERGTVFHISLGQAF